MEMDGGNGDGLVKARLASALSFLDSGTSTPASTSERERVERAGEGSVEGGVEGAGDDGEGEAEADTR